MTLLESSLIFKVELQEASCSGHVSVQLCSLAILAMFLFNSPEDFK